MDNETNNFENNETSTECNYEVVEPDRPATQGLYDDFQTESSKEEDSFKAQAVEVKTKKSGNGFWVAATAILLALCIVSSSVTFFALNSNTNKVYIPVTGTPEYTPLTAYTTDDMLTIPQIYEKVEKSVVDIIVKTSSSSGFATGVIFTTDGFIITNAHVVEGATAVSVRLYDGTEYVAELIGYDSYTEVAVLKIDATDLVPAEFGESSKLVVGEQVVAIGTPYSLSLTHTTSDGIVSAIRDDYTFTEMGLTLDIIQHTASINRGNSGGPLLNMYGQVIGINTIKIASDYENIGFAIQIESILPVVEQLIVNGKVERPQIGISGYTDPSIGGVVVAEIVEGGGAANSDLKVGDLITKIDGVRVKTIEELITLLGGYNVGDTVTLSVLRDVEVYDIEIVLQKPSE